jgi:GNAT superfamily N-acetyltransferase
MRTMTPIEAGQLTVVPANEASWADLQAIFGVADAGHCQCQRFKIRGWIWRDSTQDERTGRSEDKDDDSVWSVTCMVVRKGYRGRGLTYLLARATIDHARTRGARALEAYPMVTQAGKTITWGELHVGPHQAFEEAGFQEITRPTVRRTVMRIDF